MRQVVGQPGQAQLSPHGRVEQYGGAGGGGVPGTGGAGGGGVGVGPDVGVGATPGVGEGSTPDVGVGATPGVGPDVGKGVGDGDGSLNKKSRNPAIHDINNNNKIQPIPIPICLLESIIYYSLIKKSPL